MSEPKDQSQKLAGQQFAESLKDFRKALCGHCKDSEKIFYQDDGTPFHAEQVGEDEWEQRECVLTSIWAKVQKEIERKQALSVELILSEFNKTSDTIKMLREGKDIGGWMQLKAALDWVRMLRERLEPLITTPNYQAIINKIKDDTIKRFIEEPSEQGMTKTIVVSSKTGRRCVYTELGEVLIDCNPEDNIVEIRALPGKDYVLTMIKMDSWGCTVQLVPENPDQEKKDE